MSFGSLISLCQDYFFHFLSMFPFAPSSSFNDSCFKNHSQLMIISFITLLPSVSFIRHSIADLPGSLYEWLSYRNVDTPRVMRLILLSPVSGMRLPDPALAGQRAAALLLSSGRRPSPSHTEAPWMPWKGAPLDCWPGVRALTPH